MRGGGGDPEQVGGGGGSAGRGDGRTQEIGGRERNLGAGVGRGYQGYRGEGAGRGDLGSRDGERRRAAEVSGRRRNGVQSGEGGRARRRDAATYVKRVSGGRDRLMLLMLLMLSLLLLLMMLEVGEGDQGVVDAVLAGGRGQRGISREVVRVRVPVCEAASQQVAVTPAGVRGRA